MAAALSAASSGLLVHEPWKRCPFASVITASTCGTQRPSTGQHNVKSLQCETRETLRASRLRTRRVLLGPTHSLPVLAHVFPRLSINTHTHTHCAHLSLSLSHTHSLSLTHTRTHLYLPLFLFSPCLSLSFSLPLSLSLLSLSLSHTHTYPYLLAPHVVVARCRHAHRLAAAQETVNTAARAAALLVLLDLVVLLLRLLLLLLLQTSTVWLVHFL